MTELTVRAVWRYPVKSMLGQRIGEAEAGTHGVVGDRAWSLVDQESGMNLTARRQPELLLASARLAGTTIDEGVVITLPDGTETGDDEALSRWLQRDVRLVAAADGQAATFETQADETETGAWIHWDGPNGSFHDSSRSRISLVSTSTLGQWDLRRFRINVILDGEGEDDLVGRRFDLGDATLEATKRIDRCVMVTRPQAPSDGLDPLGRDLSVLKTINRDRDSYLGIGALIPASGRIAVGDQVVLAR